MSSSAPKMFLHDIPSDISAEKLFEIIDSHPYLLEQLREADIELYNCLLKKSIPDLRMLLMSRAFKHYKANYEKKRDYDDMVKKSIENPEDEEIQKKIEEQIRLANINEQMNLAQESLPESFGRVEMLFVKIEINNHMVNAFVDSGAQSTIMSAKCAEKCNLMRLIDTRFAGEARGVGTGKILGRIHIAQMKCGKSYYPISITILEKSDIDFLFGLDNLRRYNCILDLGKNVLRINNGEDLYEELHFLSEFEVKKYEHASESVGSTEPNSSSGSSSSSASDTVKSNTQESNSSNTNTNTNKISMDIVNPIPPSTATVTSPATAPIQPPLAAATSPVTNENAASTSSLLSTENKLAELTSMGFSIQQATIALHQAGGDVSLAASLLLDDM